MPRTFASITIDRTKTASLQDQLVAGLRRQIQSGKLTGGGALPSTRELASDLGISRNTVIAVYDRLLGEGYLESRPRTGIFVSRDVDGRIADHEKICASRARRAPTAKDQERVMLGPKPFRPSQPDVRLFPIAYWNRLRNRELRAIGSGILHYQSRFALGLPSLRHAIAKYLNDSRGVACDWTQIAITSGSQHALFLLSQLMLSRNDRVYIEDPGYRGARAAFTLAGAKLMRMRVDEQGCVPPREFRKAKLVYVTPSRQYPTGATMPAPRRMDLLQVAQRSQAWIIEDDYDSEFRYASAPLPSLHSMDSCGRVIYLGSMSKILFPSLRIGYLVLPSDLVEPLEQLRLIVDDHGPLVDQATLAAFISSGAFYSHIRRCRKVYGRRLSAFLDTARRLGIPLHFPFTDGGMNQTGFFNDPSQDAQDIARRLQHEGLDIPTLQHFSLGPARPGLVFGFSAFDEPAARAALTRVADVLRR